MAISVENQKLPAYIGRFNAHQRWQHILLALSVIMLIVTGFPIKYGYTGWSGKVIDLFGSFDNMFRVHLFFAAMMLLSGVYHLIWVIGVFLTRGPVWTMVPRWKDVTDAIHHVKYLLGFTKEPPPFDRYTYGEKFEYLAVIWGILMMGGSGLILWFPRLFTWLPRWAWDVARVIHSNEAFVAMLALFMGHFFAVHFNPKLFPTSKVWFNGKISLARMAEEHPREYKRLLQKQGIDEAAPTLTTGTVFSRSMTLIIVELLVYAAIFALLLFTFVPLLLS